jgi:hypothetical protein
MHIFLEKNLQKERAMRILLRHNVTKLICDAKIVVHKKTHMIYYLLILMLGEPQTNL